MSFTITHAVIYNCLYAVYLSQVRKLIQHFNHKVVTNRKIYKWQVSVKGMVLQKEFYDIAEIYRLADAANKGSQDTERQNSTEIRGFLKKAYEKADEKGIINMEDLTDLTPEQFFDSLLQASVPEVAHHAGSLVFDVGHIMAEKVRNNYASAINSIKKEGLESILLETFPQGLNERGKSNVNDNYSEVSQQHLKYLLSKQLAAQGNISLALESYLPRTREALKATNARMPHLLRPMAKKYEDKQKEKYLNMFKEQNGDYDTERIRDYITRNKNLASDKDKNQYYLALGLAVHNPEE